MQTTYRVQVLDRTFEILDALAEHDRPCGPARLAAHLDLHKSTVHRLLLVLEKHGYVEKSPDEGEYGLGPRLLQLGMRYAAGLDLRDRAAPLLDELVEKVGETAHVAVLRRGQVIEVANREARHALRVPSSVGQTWPLHSTALGKCILAYLPDAERDDLLKTIRFEARTRRTITTPEGLRAELKETRRRGHAIDNEEYEDGLRCIAAPIRGPLGACIATVGIEGPVTRLTRVRIPTQAGSVAEIAARLSVAMGFAGARGD